MSYKFELQKLWSLPGEAKHYAGLAKLERKFVGFTMSVGNGTLAISSHASRDGVAMIEYLSSLMGKPSVVATVERYGCVECTAEWRITPSIEKYVFEMFRIEGILGIPIEREEKVAATASPYF